MWMRPLELGLIDFGQTVEVSIELRVRYARLLFALEGGSQTEIAQAMAQLGVTTKHMNSEFMAMAAKFIHGGVQASSEFFNRYQELTMQEGGQEPDLCGWDENFMFLHFSCFLVRGSSMALLSFTHCPQALWLDLAQSFLDKHGAQYPPGPPIELDKGGSSAAAMSSLSCSAASTIEVPAVAREVPTTSSWRSRRGKVSA